MNPFKSLWAWFQTVWHKDATKKVVAAATTLADGMSQDQFFLVVDKVSSVAKEDIPGLEKAAKVEAMVSESNWMRNHQMPDWVKEGVSVLSTVVKLAWMVAKLTKRI